MNNIVYISPQNLAKSAIAKFGDRSTPGYPMSSGWLRWHTMPSVSHPDEITDIANFPDSVLQFFRVNPYKHRRVWWWFKKKMSGNNNAAFFSKIWWEFIIKTKTTTFNEIYLSYGTLVWHKLAQLWLNTLRPGRNEQHFADYIFKRIFFNENVWISIKISLKFVPKGPINNIPALVQIMAWRRSGDKPLSEPMMVSLPTHICVTRPQWVNSSPPTSVTVNRVNIGSDNRLLHSQAII